jgi:hypothetical protein
MHFFGRKKHWFKNKIICFFFVLSSLRRPEELRKRPVLPRFNSTFRYTGTYTYHQARQLLLDRPNPDFERSLSKRMTKSLDVCTYFIIYKNWFLIRRKNIFSSRQFEFRWNLFYSLLIEFTSCFYKKISIFDLPSRFLFCSWWRRDQSPKSSSCSTTISTSAKCWTIFRNSSNTITQRMFCVWGYFLSYLLIFYRNRSSS